MIRLLVKTLKSSFVKHLEKQHHLFKFQDMLLSFPHFSVPAKLINVSRDQTVLEGSNMALFCKATGKPIPNITWTRVLEDSSNSEVLHQDSTWDFSNINRTASGKYRCIAYNGFGNEASHVFKVNVTCKYISCSEH